MMKREQSNEYVKGCWRAAFQCFSSVFGDSSSEVLKKDHEHGEKL